MDDRDLAHMLLQNLITASVLMRQSTGFTEGK
jgi:hypothetical protein